MVALCRNFTSNSVQILREATVPGEYLSESVDHTFGSLHPSFEVQQNGSDSTLAGAALYFKSYPPSPLGLRMCISSKHYPALSLPHCNPQNELLVFQCSVFFYLFSHIFMILFVLYFVKKKFHLLSYFTTWYRNQ